MQFNEGIFASISPNLSMSMLMIWLLFRSNDYHDCLIIYSRKSKQRLCSLGSICSLLTKSQKSKSVIFGL